MTITQALERATTTREEAIKLLERMDESFRTSNSPLGATRRKEAADLERSLSLVLSTCDSLRSLILKKVQDGSLPSETTLDVEAFHEPLYSRIQHALKLPNILVERVDAFVTSTDE